MGTLPSYRPSFFIFLDQELTEVCGGSQEVRIYSECPRAEAIRTFAESSAHHEKKLHRLTTRGGRVFYASAPFQGGMGTLTLHPTGVRYEEKAPNPLFPEPVLPPKRQL